MRNGFSSALIRSLPFRHFMQRKVCSASCPRLVRIRLKIKILGIDAKTFSGRSGTVVKNVP